MVNTMINKQQINLINYMVVCINEFASRYNLYSNEAFKYLRNFKGINFLYMNYEVEHTLSIDDAIDDLVLICKNNGGYLE
jgi:hypothetical protein